MGERDAISAGSGRTCAPAYHSWRKAASTLSRAHTRRVPVREAGPGVRSGNGETRVRGRSVRTRYYSVHRAVAMVKLAGMETGKCIICGGDTLPGSNYTARRDDDGRLTNLPSLECVRCGAIRVDSVRVREMASEDVPSEVRIKCLAGFRPLLWRTHVGRG